MAFITLGSVLSTIVFLTVVAALPAAIIRLIRTADVYLFTDRFFQDMLARLSGPGRLRFILQPIVAIILGVRSGVKDAHAGVPPFLWALILSRQHRRELFKNALVSTRNLVAMAILLDLIAQFLIFHEIRPVVALLVGPVLIAIPYVLTRALSNRIWCYRNSRRSAARLKQA